MPLIYARLAFALAILAPLVALSTPVGSPAVFYVFVLLALIALAHNALHHFPRVSSNDFIPLAIALCLPLISVVITNAYLPAWSNSELEKNLRLALALPVFWLLIRTPLSWLRHVQWALIAAALYGSAVLAFSVFAGRYGRMSVSDYGAHYNAVTFANLTFMFGLGCLFTIGWRLSSWPKLETALKILAALASFVGTVLSETRSSWLIVPMFALIVLFSGKRWSSRTRLYCVLGAVVLMIVAAFVAWKFNPRSSQVLVEVNEFFHGGNKDTSIGNRLQLWQASLMMFQEHPWLGIGARNFRAALHVLMEKGVVTPTLVAGYGEPHDDFVAALADYGVVGFGAMLALYFLPAVVFAKKLVSPHRDVAVAAQLGLLLCLGYAMFSLTEMMFRNMRSVPIYSLTLVTFLALARSPEDALKRGSPPGMVPGRSG
jgi:O-antigen ligase